MAVVLALVLSNIGGRVSRDIGLAVCNVARAGGLVAGCEEPGPWPPPGPSPDPPVQPVTRPDPVCTADGSGGYHDLTVVVPAQVLNLRGSIRVFYTIGKVVAPGKRDRWVVSVGAFTEGGVQTPDLPLVSGMWLGGNVTGTQYYSFDNEQEARDFPRRYAEQRARQAVRYHPVVLPLLSVPVVGDWLSDLIGGHLPEADRTAVEIGPAGGLNPGLNIGAVDLSAASRGWSLLGVQHDRDGNWIVNMRDRVLSDPTLTVDLSKLPKQVTRRGAQAVLNELELLGMTHFGPHFEIPAKLRDYVNRSVANGVKLGATVELIAQNDYQYMLDSKGTPVRFTRQVTTSWTLRGRGNINLGGGGSKVKIPATGQIPIDGGRQVSTSSLDLSDPMHRRAATALFTAGVLQRVGAVGLSSHRQAQLVDSLFRTRGTMTRLTYDELVSGRSGGLENLVGKLGGAIRYDGENSRTTLTGAEIWQNGRGWVPWTDCHR
ncbi:hypothetical protein ABZ801_28000 [Actinomadura sp. NPDC047616]|uniref:hypothetical protein n=1 Tax=Actinomadura sp. NPDC047616 TaxID=3155914 RepID=UPI0033FF3110